MSKILPTIFYYFAYGSNLYSQRIRLANKSATFYGIGFIKDFKLEFGHISERWRGAAANIVENPGEKVYGVVWQLSKEDHDNLDNQEGVKDQIYQRLEVNVSLIGPKSDGEEVPCIVYQLTQSARNRSIDLEKSGVAVLKPSIIYKNIMIKGARENGLPTEYIEFLEGLPDNGYEGPVEINLSLHKMNP